MNTIFLVLERFNHYSDVLRGGLIRELAKKYRIVVLTPDLDNETARFYEYFQHENVIYRKLGVRYRWLWNFSEKYLRKYLVREHDDLFTTKYLYYFYPTNLRERVLRDLGRFLPRSIATAEKITRFERWLARPTREFLNLVKEYRPSVMVTATPGFGWLPLVAECVVWGRRLKIPTIAINSSFDNPYTLPKFIRKTDYLAVWSERMKKESEEFFKYPSDRIFITGCLKFDHYLSDQREGRLRSREEFLKAHNLDPGKKTLVYITPTPGTYKNRHEAMIDLVRLKQRGRFDGDPNILVRLHPFDVWEPYQEFTSIPGVFIERAGRQRVSDRSGIAPKVEMEEYDLRNLTETMLYCDVLLSFNSTMMLEASMLHKPSVCLGWPKRVLVWYSDPVGTALLESGATRLARTPRELAALVNQYLLHPELDEEQRRKLVEEFVFFTDGLAYQRTADCVAEVIRRTTKNNKSDRK